MKAMGTAALADPYATALQSRKSCCILLVIFFISCVALCFVAAARTDSEQNEEKHQKKKEKITPLVIFKFLILENLICYCHSNLGGFYYTIIGPFLADNGWQRYSSKKYKHYK